MNITESIRKNNKHYKPIIVFKQLFRDYFQHKHVSPSNIQTNTSSFNELNKLKKWQTNMTLQTSIQSQNQGKQCSTNKFKMTKQQLTQSTLMKSKSNINLYNYHIKNNKKEIIFREEDKVRKTNSTEKLTKYLLKFNQNSLQQNDREMELHNHGISTARNSSQIDLKQQSKFRIQNKRSKSIKINSKQHKNTYVFKLLERTQLEEIQKQKRGYFKNQYTKNHPLFEKNINNFKLKPIEQKENQIPTLLPDIYKENLSQKLKTPVQRRIQLSELKTKFNEKRQVAVEKFSKIRYNYLVNKHLENQIQSNEHPMEHKKIMSCLQKTKQNIFPGNSQL